MVAPPAPSELSGRDRNASAPRARAAPSPTRIEVF